MNQDGSDKTEDSVEAITGVREYLWPETEILFVQCKCQSSLLTHLGRAGKGCP